MAVSRGNVGEGSGAGQPENVPAAARIEPAELAGTGGRVELGNEPPGPFHLPGSPVAAILERLRDEWRKALPGVPIDRLGRARAAARAQLEASGYYQGRSREGEAPAESSGGSAGERDEPAPGPIGGPGSSSRRPYLDPSRINRASLELAAERLDVTIWRNVYNTPDGRRGPEGVEAVDPGDGWSYQLEPGPGPRAWAPVASWDLPEPDGELGEEGPSGPPLEDPAPADEGTPGLEEPGPRYPKPGRPRYCGRYSVVGVLRGEDVESGNARMGCARVYCRRYLCPVCGPGRARATREAIRGAVEKHRLQRMLTLTLDPGRLEPGEDPHDRIKRAFAKLRYRWAKAYRNGVEYVSVVEHHKSGMPHLHLAISRFIPRKAIQRWWVKAGGGVQVWISWRDQGRAGAYIGKYLGKQVKAELAGDLMPLRSRRVHTSRGVRLFAPREPAGWRFIREGIDRLAWAAASYRLVLDSMTVEVDYARRLRFLVFREEHWPLVAFLSGIPV